MEPGAASNDFFELARYALREELGLEPYEYGPISLSWIGYDVHTLQVKIFAQVKSSLFPAEIERRVGSAHGIFELQDLCWLRLAPRVFQDIVDNWEEGDSVGRRWSSSAPLALQELWRMRYEWENMAPTRGS